MSRRLAALAGASALSALATLGLAAGPALAAAPTITVTAPADLTQPVATAVVHFEGTATMPSGGSVNANSVTFTVTSPDGHPGAQATIQHGAANSVSFFWDFASSYNGTYHVVITATGRDGAIDTSANEQGQWQGDVGIEAKPAPPSGLKAAKTRDRTVELTWASNPEPDVIGYQVQRTTGTGSKAKWTPLANVAGPAYTDETTADAAGTYTYRVTAVRQGATAERIAVSDPSATASAQVPAPPATTTTTPSGGSGSGSGGSGSGSGSTGSGGTSTRTGTSSGGTASPELARTGKADLSGFTALLQQAQRPGAKPGKTQLPDGTYVETLPFKPGEDGLGEDGTALGVGVREEGGGEAGRKPIAFVAASLLVTVILMHVLWLKREVEKAPLEAAPVTD